MIILDVAANVRRRTHVWTLVGRALRCAPIQRSTLDVRRSMFSPLYLLSSLLLPLAAIAQTESVTTLAGSVLTSGNADGPAAHALFSDPTGLALNTAGNIFIVDNQNHTIREYTATGYVTTLAGQPGQPGSKDGTGTNASFNNPTGIVFAPNGLLYVADTGNNMIRFVTTNGTVTTLSGSVQSGTNDGSSSDSRFNLPLGIAADKSSVLYVADSGNHSIRRVLTNGTVRTIAGSPGVWGSADGAGTAALFNGPVGVAVDTDGNIFVSDANNHTIRKITPGGMVSTFAGLAGADGTNDGVGSMARFGKPAEMRIDRGNNLFVVDSFYHTIRRISTNAEVTTIAGAAGSGGSADGSGAGARFFNPYGLAIDHNGNLRVSDTYNQTLRFVYVPITVSLNRNSSGGDFVISWQAVVGDSYQALYRDLATGAAWQNLGGAVMATNSTGTQTDASAGTTGQRVYRVRLMP
jgi:NHL repeat